MASTCEHTTLKIITGCCAECGEPWFQAKAKQITDLKARLASAEKIIAALQASDLPLSREVLAALGAYDISPPRRWCQNIAQCRNYCDCPQPEEPTPEPKFEQDAAIDDLFRWRDGTTDWSGDDLVALLYSDFSGRGDRSSDYRVPPSLQAALKRYQAMSEEEQWSRAKAYAAYP